MKLRGSGRKRTSVTRFASGVPVLKENDETKIFRAPAASGGLLAQLAGLEQHGGGMMMGAHGS
jgi:hypothetical protein